MNLRVWDAIRLKEDEFEFDCYVQSQIESLESAVDIMEKELKNTFRDWNDLADTVRELVYYQNIKDDRGDDFRRFKNKLDYSAKDR